MEENILTSREFMQAPYKSLTEIIELIDEPNRTACVRLVEDNKELFTKARGSKTKHQAWTGGYLDHVVEASNIAIVFYPTLNALRPLPFTLSDVLLVLFLHDLEKPWKHDVQTGRWRDTTSLDTKSKIHEFVEQKIRSYGFQLTDEHRNGLKYVEGENQDYHPEIRVQGPLAAFAHLGDLASARIFFDHPLQENDPWQGSKRSNPE
ncbi:MAG: hypothetical protein Q8L34_02885 [Candidatus Woesearchaeota archaeon]|nr:hypothetical protein [Candidatus Woesearchaeota archaeon]